ncbi:MAG: elongator complex protein 3 [Acutalibacteraceae bacterium]
MKHSNVALFVPHNGCPHQCSFCNQRTITGKNEQPTAQDVKNAIETAENSLGENTKNAEIAFFGGSFTAIDRNYMIELLEAAAPSVHSGRFYGIRISTRPDAIDSEILDILQKYGVTAVELGAQSMSDEVLYANHRGHTSADIVNASTMIKERGMSLGLQMMTGLYKSDDEKDTETAEKIAALKPDTVRIYPTIVLKGTELYDLYVSGKYQPQTLDEGVRLCSKLLKYFEDRNINVIRLGLHDSDSLRENMAAGAYHPAFRELCESEIMYNNALEELEKMNIKFGVVEFFINPKSVSRFIGQKRKNLDRLSKLGITAVVRQDSRLSKYQTVCRYVPQI